MVGKKMQRSERKSRLAPSSSVSPSAGGGAGGTGEFIGFGAFANSSSSAPSLSSLPISKSGGTTNTARRLLPAYVGTDSNLAQLFRRIGQKRDPTTKRRALEELRQYAFSSSEDESSASGPPKPERVAALSHLLHLACTKIGYDSHPSVRAECLVSIDAARACVPRAWKSLIVDRCTGEGDNDDDDGMSNIVGLVWCARSDPAAEVSMAASALIRTIFDVFSENFGKDAGIRETKEDDLDGENTKIPSNTAAFGKISHATCRFVTWMLSHARPSNLHESLFGKPNASNTNNNRDGKKKSEKVTPTREATHSYSETEREEMEERFDRSVQSALDGLADLFRSQLQPSDANHRAEEDSISGYFSGQTSKLFWRHAVGSRSHLRRATMRLLSAICIGVPSVLHLDDTSDWLQRVMSSERDPSNIPAMLEALLLYISALNKINGEGAAWSEDQGGFDVSVVCKSLSKSLRKAFHGSPTHGWAPTILPLVAKLPCDDDSSDPTGGLGFQNQIVASLWEGHSAAMNGTDAVAIVSAVVECSAFLLIRKNHYRVVSQNNDANDDRGAIRAAADECAGYFLRGLSYYLAGTGDFWSSSAEIRQQLAKTLADALNKLESSFFNESPSENENSSAIGSSLMFFVDHWFWKSGVRDAMIHRPGDTDGRWMDDDAALTQMANLIRGLNPSKKDSQHKSQNHRIHPILREIAQKMLLRFRSSRQGAPTTARCALLLTVLQTCPVVTIFNPSGDDAGPSSTPSGTIGLETFCLNDLLQWMVVRCQPTTGQRKSTPLQNLGIETDFAILRECLFSIPSALRQRDIWQSILGELIKANCDRGKVSLGLAVLAKPGTEFDRIDGVTLIRCETLDLWAGQIADDVESQFWNLLEERRTEYDNKEYDDGTGGALDIVDAGRSDRIEAYQRGVEGAFALLRTCAGVPARQPPLVSAKVAQHWIDLVCRRRNSPLPFEDAAGANVLLEVVLSLFVFKSPLIDASVNNDDDNEHGRFVEIALESWRQGGRLWYGLAVDLLHSTPITESVITAAGALLKKDITDAQGNSGDNDDIGHQTLQGWPRRAWRLLQLRSGHSSTFMPTLPALSIIGLDDLDIWRSVTGTSTTYGRRRMRQLFSCLTRLLEYFDEVEDRRMLLWESRIDGCNEQEIMTEILISLTEDDVVHNISFRRRIAHCEELISLLGGRESVAKNFIESCCMGLINLLSVSMQEASQNDNKHDAAFISRLYRSVAVLDLLIDVLLGNSENRNASRKPPTDDDIEHNQIKEGDVIWYVVNPNQSDSPRVQATVMKVHADDFPNLYYTIRLEGGDNGLTEKQTVVDRLKRQEQAPASERAKETKNESETGRRRKIEENMVTVLVKPHLSQPASSFKTKVAEIAAECLNIVLSKCGLGGKVGLGSIRYDSFKMISALQSSAFDISSTRAQSTHSLRCLALSLGFGCVTKPNPNGCAVLKLDPKTSLESIIQISADEYKAMKDEQGADFIESILMFIAVSMSTVTDGDVFRGIMRTLRIVGSVLLEDHKGRENAALLVMRAFYEAQSASKNCIDYSSDGSEDERYMLGSLLRCFASNHSGPSRAEKNQKYENIPVHSVSFDDGGFVSMLMESAMENKDNVLSVLPPLANNVCDALFSTQKQLFAFRLLRLLALTGDELPENNWELSDQSKQRASRWKEGLDQEEVEELDEDINVTAKRLPTKLRIRIEDWGERSSKGAELGNKEITGALLLWLVTLDFFDSAPSIDERHKSSMRAYLSRTEAVAAILSLAISFANLDNRNSKNAPNLNVEGWLEEEEEEDFELAKLATLVVFRTVESLPTLARTWWNESCPRSRQNAIQQFVEHRVAPETLRSELTKINSATDLGEMTVTGSTMTREVVASYVQDECQLSVMIRVPPSFPLRNVEVDCRKTLGIPEKRWRRWALQILRMLNNQDESVLDALLFWKQNVDKEFEGVEPCPVCYSVLSVKTHAMPNLECKTCGNRFHSSCLIKWFRSSGKNQCVLCQQPWSGMKV